MMTQVLGLDQTRIPRPAVLFGDLAVRFIMACPQCHRDVSATQISQGWGIGKPGTQRNWALLLDTNHLCVPVALLGAELPS